MKSQNSKTLIYEELAILEKLYKEGNIPYKEYRSEKKQLEKELNGNKNIFSQLISIIFVLGVGIGVYNFFVDKQNAYVQDVQESSIAISEVSAEELLSEYNKNEINADSLYKDKRINTYGNIQSIEKDFLGYGVVKIKAGRYSSISCYVNEENLSTFNSSKIGDNIKVSGIVQGMIIGNVSLKECNKL